MKRRFRSAAIPGLLAALIGLMVLPAPVGAFAAKPEEAPAAGRPAGPTGSPECARRTQ